MAQGLAEQILQSLPRPVWLIDDAGLIAFANEAAAHQLGYRDGRDLLGRPSHDTVHHRRPDGSAYPAEECPVLRPAGTGRAVTSEDQWFIRRDDSQFPIAWSAVPIELDDGRGIVLSFSDISHHRQRDRLACQRRWADADIDRHSLPDRFGAERPLDALTLYIRDRVTDPTLSPQVLARAFHVSVRTIQLTFADAGTSPARYIRQERLNYARLLLADGLPVAVTGRRAGFADTGTFARAFRRQFGISPSAYAETLSRTGPESSVELG